MKLAILAADSERHDYFVLKLIEAFPDAVVVHEPKGGGIRRSGSRLQRFKRDRHKPTTIKNAAAIRLFGSAARKLGREKSAVEKEYFGEASLSFRESYTEHVVGTVQPGGSINSTESVERILSLKPDIIAVMGTSLLRPPVINAAKTAVLNIHTGLSPYYRGGRANFWPLYKGQPQYCGVTIHYLTTGIDSGPILFHGRPNIVPEDTFPTLNCKSIVIGSELMIKAINSVDSGDAAGIPQTKKVGRLYFNRDYNAFSAWKYSRRLNRGLIPDFLAARAHGDMKEPEGLQIPPGADGEG